MSLILYQTQKPRSPGTDCVVAAEKDTIEQWFPNHKVCGSSEVQTQDLLHVSQMCEQA